jgi:carbon-monoxide dehydrogenase medium subunit
MHCDAYHLPGTVDEALRLLAQYQGRARVIGGGTDYFVDDRSSTPQQALVDVTRIPALREIRQEDGRIVIGCGVTHAQITQSVLIQERATALAEACGQIGGPQVRNVATLAGNVAHALPAADGMLALLALDGQVCVASLNADGATATYEWWPLVQAYRGPGESAIDSTRQVLVAVRFRPTGTDEGSAFARVMRPQGVALPVMAAAVKMQVTEGILRQASIALGPVTRLPFRASQTEAFLAGKPADEQTIRAASSVLLNECSPRTSPHRATAEYRRELIPVLFEQAALTAIGRCASTRVIVQEERG